MSDTKGQRPFLFPVRKMSKEKYTPPSPPRKVRCSGCCNAVRDTEGISFAIATGEFFMGTCLKGHGHPYKVFMDKARVCEDYNKPITEDQPANKEQDEDKEEYTEVIRSGWQGEKRQENRQNLLFDA